MKFMDIQILSSENELGQVASQAGASIIRSAIRENGIANIILATGTSQLATLKYLVREKAVEWSKVVMFHLDEYVGISNKAPASFCKYIQDRFLSKLPPLHATYLINGQAETVGECRRLKKLIQKCPIDLAFVGIGENGHLAFNDPPANFVTKEPFLVVQLDEACRMSLGRRTQEC